MNDPRWVAPSEKAVYVQQSRFKAKYDFPFDEVPLHMSFSVGKADVKNINVLRTIANRSGIKLNRKFRVVEHETVYEVFYVGVRDVSSI